MRTSALRPAFAAPASAILFALAVAIAFDGKAQAPTNALESAILITLQPGAYTAVLSGVGGGTGVGIVEVFAQ